MSVATSIHLTRAGVDEADGVTNFQKPGLRSTA